MSIVEHYEDITEAYHAINKALVYGKGSNGDREDWDGVIDFTAPMNTASYANLVTADSCVFDIDFEEDVWMSKTRWTRFLRSYVDPEKLLDFYKLCMMAKKKGRSRAPEAGMPLLEGGSHTWGGCLTSMAFRWGSKQKPNLTLVSRVSSFPQTAALDLALVYLLAEDMAPYLRLKGAEDFTFTWLCGQFQFNAFRGMSWVYNRFDPKLEGDLPILEWEAKKWRSSAYPTWKVLRRAQRYNTADSKYGPARRMGVNISRHRGLDEVPITGEHVTHRPPLPTSSLTFDTLVHKTPRKDWKEWKESMTTHMEEYAVAMDKRRLSDGGGKQADGGEAFFDKDDEI